jgi:Na+-transporting NADH:ubiquinone oxidoreductase subunit NqrB
VRRDSKRLDPRLYQITVLSSLLLYGFLTLDFEMTVDQASTVIATALITQFLFTRAYRLPVFDPRSVLISALSLCLLLRTNDLWIDVVGAVLAIASKFLIRVRGKHLFNPTNVALVLLIGLTDRAWVSPGQWGTTAIFALFTTCLGGLVVNRAARSDVTYAFLIAYLSLLFGRSVWLGEPPAIPIHRITNGGLVIFTFFMISDPKTTPDSRAGRILFAALVAAGAYYVQFGLFRTNGLLWSLAACSLLVPLIDHFLPGRRYEWLPAPAAVTPGGIHEALPGLGVDRRAGLATH